VICQTRLSVANEGVTRGKRGDTIVEVRQHFLATCRKLDILVRARFFKLVESSITDVYNGRSSPSFSSFNICHGILSKGHDRFTFLDWG
jgi:hypothetical protein